MYEYTMTTMVFCYDVQKMMYVLGMGNDVHSYTDPLMTLVFTSTNHACTFYLGHFYNLHYLGMYLDLDKNLIHVRMSDIQSISIVLAYFYMYYKPLTTAYDVIQGVLYSTIVWIDL